MAYTVIAYVVMALIWPQGAAHGRQQSRVAAAVALRLLAPPTDHALFLTTSVHADGERRGLDRIGRAVSEGSR